MRCDFKDHVNQQILAICTRKECDQQSANCQQCITQLHSSCVDSLISIEELPTELEKFKSQYEQINETFESLIQLLKYFQEQYSFQLQSIIEFNGTPNLANLNKLGQFLKSSPLMDIKKSTTTGSELIKKIIERYLNPNNQKIISLQEIALAKDWGKKGVQHSQNHEFYKAIQCYDRALSINPFIDSFWNDKGLALVQIGQYVEALQCFDEALKISPNNSQTIYYKAQQLNRLQRFNEAIQCCDQSLLQNPHQCQALSAKAFALGNLNQFTEALVCLDSILAIYPNEDSALQNKGITLKNCNKFEEAIQCFDQAINIKPNHIRYYYKGYSLSKLNKLKEAEEQYFKALEFDPNYEPALKQLSILQAQMKQ